MSIYDVVFSYYRDFERRGKSAFLIFAPKDRGRHKIIHSECNSNHSLAMVKNRLELLEAICYYTYGVAVKLQCRWNVNKRAQTITLRKRNSKQNHSSRPMWMLFDRFVLYGERGDYQEGDITEVIERPSSTRAKRAENKKRKEIDAELLKAEVSFETCIGLLSCSSLLRRRKFQRKSKWSNLTSANLRRHFLT